MQFISASLNIIDTMREASEEEGEGRHLTEEDLKEMDAMITMFDGMFSSSSSSNHGDAGAGSTTAIDYATIEEEEDDSEAANSE